MHLIEVDMYRTKLLFDIFNAKGLATHYFCGLTATNTMATSMIFALDER